MEVNSLNLRSIFKKLRRNDRKEYLQFEYCLIFANILVSSFCAVLFSPFIQTALPPGGDSRKLIYLIFGIAIVGCFIFVIYAAGLFLRQKSRQVGVFLALGIDKRKLTKTMIGEVTYITLRSTLIGVIFGNVMGFAIGQVFEKISAIPGLTNFQLSLTGLIPTLLFAFVVLFALLVMTSFKMKYSNVMDIINERRKSEQLRNEISKSYLIFGVVMFLTGVFVAVILPNLYVIIFKQFLGPWTNIFYLLCVRGLYQFLVYSIAVHKRGRNPQKYYRNLISYGMLKFQGISMVRNMILITLLIICASYSAFYGPTFLSSDNSSKNENPVDVSYNQLGNSEWISKNQVVSLADKYDLDIKGYKEVPFIELLSSTVIREPDKSGKIIETYEKRGYYQQFTSVTEINKAFGRKLTIKDGTYKMIRSNQMKEDIYSTFGDMDFAENMTTAVGKKLKFAGTERFNELVTNTGWDGLARYIISDQDYGKLRAGISEKNSVTQVLINFSDPEDSFMFSKAIFKVYSENASDEAKIGILYDPYRHKDEEAPNLVDVQPDHPELDYDWKYQPYSKILEKKYHTLKTAVLNLLFIYVSVVMLASVGVIGYTRSKSIGMQNQQVFEDLRKLGANNTYLIRCINAQLQKVYLLPTVFGLGIAYIYFLIIYKQNDGVFSSFEVTLALVCLAICLFIAAYQYIGYRISLREVKRIVNID